MRAWPFLVVSSDKQSETLAHQRAWAEETAAAKGWTLERIGDFEDVQTGKKGPRKLIVRMLAEIEALEPATRPQWVLMLRLDRVGRGSIVDGQVVVHRLRELGVRVWTRDGGEEKNDSAMEQLITAAKLAVGAYENEVRIEKSLNAHARKRKAGQHAGHAPYGTVLIEHRPVAYEPEATIVRKLFDLRLNGWGFHRLARYAAEHAPPKRRRDGGFRELKWDESTVTRMMATRTYRGVVVPEDVFDAVQGLRHPGIQRESKYPWPLRSAVRCTCGHMLTTCYSGPKNHRKRYYLCRNVAVHRERYPYHDAASLEAQFVDLLRELAADPALHAAPHVANLDEMRAQRQRLEEQMVDLERRRRRAWELAEESNIGASDLRERINEITTERRRVESEVQRIDQEISAAVSSQRAHASTSEALAFMAEGWPIADTEMRREIAKAVAAYVGGLYAAPPTARGARATRLLKGTGSVQTHIRQ